MIAQSLGGMEIVVGMSLLAGGLVLDKGELVQGSKLPSTISLLQLFFFFFGVALVCV